LEPFCIYLIFIFLLVLKKKKASTWNEWWNKETVFTNPKIIKKELSTVQSYRLLNRGFLLVAVIAIVVLIILASIKSTEQVETYTLGPEDPKATSNIRITNPNIQKAIYSRKYITSPSAADSLVTSLAFASFCLAIGVRILYFVNLGTVYTEVNKKEDVPLESINTDLDASGIPDASGIQSPPVNDTEAETATKSVQEINDNQSKAQMTPPE